MANSPTDWVVTLLLFNTIFFLLLVGFSTTFADYSVVEERAENSLLPDFLLTLIVGVQGAPTWFNTILVLQIALSIYLLITAITGGG